MSKAGLTKALDQSTRGADVGRLVSAAIVFIKGGIVEMIESHKLNLWKSKKSNDSFEYLHVLDKAFSMFRDVYPEMSLRQAALFVNVAKKEGINHSELTETLSIPQTSVSRIVLRLARRIRDGKNGAGKIDGLDLIENRQDIYKTSKHAVYLTDRGQALREKLVECFECLKADF